jgi:Beta-propeller repeat
MKSARFLLFTALVATAALEAAPATSASTSELLARVPLRFEQNLGQIHANEPVSWTARNPEASYAFTADGALIRTRGGMVRVRMQGSNAKAEYKPLEALASPTSYFTASYKGSIRGYQKLRRSSVYPGIDVVYYGKGTQLEYDFEVAPGADPSQIRLAFESESAQGATPHVTEAGDLQIGDSANALIERAPVVYQVAADGSRKRVSGGYRVAEDGSVTLALGAYDRSAKLVIDPVFVYTQYLFSPTIASPAVAITHDAQGFVYVAGNTQATDFYLQGTIGILGNQGGQDVWIMKINPTAADGNFVPFTTLYGGGLNEIVQGIAVDNNGIAYITGVTQSTNLPTVNPYASTLPGAQNTFVAAFDTTQAVQTYGTYLGGTQVDYVAGIAVSGGKIYVTGTTTSINFPVTAASTETAPRGGTEVFVTELNPALSGTAQLIASILIPGAADDRAAAIAVDATGNIYLAGETGSPDYPITANAVQTVYNQSGEGYVIKLNPQMTQVLYGTYLGGSNYDQISSLVVEPGGRIGVTGLTLSNDFPTTQNALQAVVNPQSYSAAFLTILDPAAKVGAGPAYSTYFSGNFAEAAFSLARDKNGLYYICGYTLSTNLPQGTKTAANALSAGGGIDGFVAQIDPTKGINGLIYSSYITSQGDQIASGVDVDSNGLVYVTGWATASIFAPGQAIFPNTGITDGYLLAFRP